MNDSGNNLGAASSNLKGHSNETFYLTTAIAYTNGFPHIGHAYEFISADVIVRYYRIFGHDTFFLTGADEHGQKVAASAEASGRTPMDHCDFYVNAFKSLNSKLKVSYSRYIRTTDQDHIDTSQKLWNKCAEADDIYLGSYEGWYNEREEVFVTDAEAEAAEFKDKGSGLPLKRVTEESYFFKMSKYCDSLIAHIEENPQFVQPEQFRNNILARLRKEGLKDLSISRTSFTWGIPVPSGFDQKHVMYVWFDALTNYLSGIHALELDDELSKYWPPNREIIGKDIIWFHCVIWPCMLMSANLRLPEVIFSHGFVNASDGRKMSKSYNNTIDPNDILNKYNVDSIRYYLTASITYGADINFSEDGLITMHNSELADILGNLIHRVFNLCAKYCNGVVPNVQHDNVYNKPFDLDTLINEVRADLKLSAINVAVFRAMEAVRSTNRFLTEAEPWKMKGEDENRRPAIVRTTLEAVYAFMHFLAPVIPLAAQTVFEKLGTDPIPLYNLKSDFYNLIPGTAVTVGSILFSKIDVNDHIIESTILKSTKPIAKETKASFTIDANQSDFTKLDIRVGKITNIRIHESADRLYCEDIDVGEEIKIPVASGLRQYYKIEELENKLVLVVCNLKESKIVGFLSRGMVLAAKSPDGSKVELLEPPPGSIVGERVFIEGLQGDPFLPNQIKKFKIWENVIVDLKTNESCVACWKGMPLLTSLGNCKTQTLSLSQLS
eukprot:gene17132-22646_t